MTSNAGWIQYGDTARPRKFFRACGRSSFKATIKSGQVLKEGTLLTEEVTTGKLVAHTGMVEKAVVTFAGQTSAKTVILAGLTFTTTAATSAADLVAAFSGLAVGTTAAQANAQNPSTVGSFTAGTLALYNTVKGSTVNTVVFVASAPNTNTTDVADTGTATGNTIAITAFPASTAPVAGILMYDTNASAGDKVVEVYGEASFWASYLKWSNDPAVDTVTNADGTTTVCTDYYTGATNQALQLMLMTGSEFKELGFLSAGEEALLDRGELA